MMVEEAGASPLHVARTVAISDAVKAHCESMGLDANQTARVVDCALDDFLVKGASGARAVSTGKRAAARIRFEAANVQFDSEQRIRQRRQAWAFCFAIVVVIGFLLGIYNATHAVAP